jgi:hypothetical protein
MLHSPNLIRTKKLKRLKWATYGSRMGDQRHARRVLVGKPDVGFIGVGGKLTLK